MTVMNRAREGMLDCLLLRLCRARGSLGGLKPGRWGLARGPAGWGRPCLERRLAVESISLAKTNKHIAYINHTL